MALTAVFTMAFILSGFGWWTNKRMYDADKSYLKDEFDTKINTIKTSVEIDLESSRTDFLQLVDDRIDKNTDRLLSNISEVKLQLKSTRDDIENRGVTIEKELKRISSKNLYLEKRIDSLSATLREVEEHIWDLKGIPANILVTQSQGLGSAINAGFKAPVINILKRMKETIEYEFIKKGASLSMTGVEIINRELDKANNFDAILVADIKKMLSDVSEKKVEG